MTPKKFDFWIKNNYNVLFSGHHGVGKTAKIIEAFNRNGLKWKYFSASTLDPWVDFCGIPKEVSDENGNSYIDLIRPKCFAEDEVEAIFLDEYNRCFTGDTKILSPDGNSYAIRDLVGKEYFYTYSFDEKTRAICIGKGHSARITRKNAEIIKVKLDNGTIIRCTKDHPFLLLNGTYKEAHKLSPNESLFPLYKTWNKKGYEKIYQPCSNGRFDLTYMLANEYNIKTGKYKHVNKYHRHHIDFNKNNNSPENIIELSKHDHLYLHTSNLDFCAAAGKKLHEIHPDLYSRTIGTPESKKRAKEASLKSRINNPVYLKRKSSSHKKYFSTPNARQNQADNCKKQWKAGNFNRIDRQSALIKNHINRIVNLMIDTNTNVETIEDYNKLIEKAKHLGKSMLKLETFFRYNYSIESLNKLRDEKLFKRKILNHRIVSIEPDGIEDVYDITVDEYQNFALEAGVFVHNCPVKVQNATMELIQFKSINGKKFNNLRFIWAAINPPKTNDSDIEYSVEKLDPAQIDRFQIYVEIPYKLSIPYFIQKFGENVALISANWWNELTESDKLCVSPRRLDYALDVYIAGGDIRDVVPKNINVNRLVNELSNGSYKSRLEKIFEDKNSDAAKAFLEDVNCLDNTLSYIVKNDEFLSFFLPHIPNEPRAQLAGSNKTVLNHMISNIDKYGQELNILSKTDSKIKKAIGDITLIDNSKFHKLTYSKCDYTKIVLKESSLDCSYSNLSDLLAYNRDLHTTAARRGAYYDLVSFLHIKCRYFLSKVPIDNSPIQLSTDEILLTINFLNYIIDSTRSFGSYNNITEIYGAMCRIYYMRGRMQNYSILSGNVKSFILENIHLYA